MLESVEKEIQERKNKRPAHEVIVCKLREVIETLTDQSDPKLEVESIPLVLKMGMICVLLEVLKEMVIPEGNFDIIFDDIKEIKETCPIEYREKLLPEKFFLIFNESQK